MKVRELIERLEKLDKDLPVYIVEGGVCMLNNVEERLVVLYYRLPNTQEIINTKIDAVILEG